MTAWLVLACASAPGLDPEGRCHEEGPTLSCEHQVLELHPGLVARQVLWQVPLGEAPAEGWPVALLFQGAEASAELFWRTPGTRTGSAWTSTRITQTLLDKGFAVITPKARGRGWGAWDTNLPGHAQDWEGAPDHLLMLDLLDAIEQGDFGDLDPDRLFAGGISSGGYMSSRVGTEYPGCFQALFIHSGSWRSCAGAFCALPEELPGDHPPTMFQHGEWDTVVPMRTAERYHQALDDAGVDTLFLAEPRLGHNWAADAPEAMLSWFGS